MTLRRLLFTVLVINISSTDSCAFNECQSAKFDSCIEIMEKLLLNESSDIERVKLYNLLGRAYVRNYDYSKALDSYNKALDLLKKSGAYSSDHYISSLLGKSDVFLVDRKNDSITQAISEIGKIITDTSSNYGLYLFHKGNSQTAIDNNTTKTLYLKSLHYIPMHDDHSVTSRIILSDLLLEANDMSNGYKFIQQAIGISKKYFPNDNLLLARCYNMLVYYYYKMDQLPKAIITFQDSALVKIRSNNSGDEYLKSELFRIISWVYQDAGNYNTAIQYSIKNLEVKKSFLRPDHAKLGEAYFWVGLQYYSLGLFSKSQAYIKYAMPIFNTNSIYAAQCYLILGVINHKTDRFNDALNYYRKAVSISNKNYNADVLESTISLSAAWANVSLGKLGTADSLANKYINKQKARSSPSYTSLGEWYLLKAQILKLKNQDKEAKELYRQGIEALLNNNIYKHLALYRLSNNYAAILLEENSLDEAKEALNLSMNDNIDSLSINGDILSEEEYSNGTKILTLYLVGRYFYDQYLLKKEIICLKKSHYFLNKARISYLENKSSLALEISSRIFNHSYYDRIFRLNFEVLYKLSKVNLGINEIEMAFQVSEKAKGSTLHEAQQTFMALKSDNISDDTRLAEYSLKEELNYIKSKLRKEVSSNDILLNRRLFNLQSDHDSLIAYLETNYPEYYRLKYDFSTISIKEVQNKLMSHEAVIEYFNGEDSTYAFTITKDTVVFSRIESVNETKIAEYRKLLDQPTGSYIDYTRAAHKLYEQIVRIPLLPIDTTEITTLRIIPDGLLNLIPFESLITSRIDNGKSANYKRLPYLYKRYNISYGYSSTSMFKFQEPYKQKLHEPAILAMAPATSVGEDQSQLASLKFNVKEVTNLKDYFDNHAVTGLNATEDIFKRNVNSYPIVHLAMHALVNNEDPMDSKMLFAPSQDTLEDGMLHTFELYNMRLNTNMVVLSACNTGSGKLQKGEGVMSLAKAFTYAGSPSVVMSHWLVDDKSTAELMQYFYRHLAEGQPKDGALRNAKLDFLDNASPLYHHPYYWNNFVVVGDPSPVVSKFQYPYQKALILCLIVLFASVLGLSERVRCF